MLVCGYSYAIHSRTHYDELDRVLHGIATHVRTEVGATHTTETEPDVIASAPLLGAGIRLLDRDGCLRAASGAANGLSAVDVPALFRAKYERPYPAVATLVPALHRPATRSRTIRFAAGTWGRTHPLARETLSVGEAFW